MTRDIYTLLLAQFLSAFADNAVLFAIIAMVMGSGLPAWYVPVLQGSFLVAFVLFAPWVGPFADRHSKNQVLIGANGVKAVGGLLLLAGLEPLAAYAVIGLGAAAYGPAKYGILPELVGHERLVKANGWLEGATIVAILTGSLVGAKVAEGSVTHALDLVVLCYLASAAISLFIARTPPVQGGHAAALPHFLDLTRRLLASHRARFAILGVALFWAAAAVLRVELVAWAPLALDLHQPSQIAELTLYSAIGIALGALLAPRFIPLERLDRARLAAYLMGVSIVALSLAGDLWTARAVLLAVGVSGGMFVVPINAALQEVGHHTVGAGGAVAVQNFFENLAMLGATGLYAVAAGEGAAPAVAIVTLGAAVLAATRAVSQASRRGLEEAVE